MYGVGEGRDEVREVFAGVRPERQHHRGRVRSELGLYFGKCRGREGGIELAKREHEAANKDRGYSATMRVR